MVGKQEIFEAFCEYCTDAAEEGPVTGWLAEMRMKTLAAAFEFYYEFFNRYMQHSPGSS